METRTALILIAGMAAVTLLTRLPLVVAVVRPLRPPPLAGAVLEHVPIAAMAAIVAPAVLRPGGEVALRGDNLYLAAAAVTLAAGLALRGRVLATTAVGVATAIALKALLG